MLNVRVKKALLTILTACLTVLMTIGAVLGFTPTTQTVKAAGNAPSVGGGYFEKVTSTPSDWSEYYYLIVYETDSVAFNGGLSTLDAGNNIIKYTIENGNIVADDNTAGAWFTINESGHIKSASGYYIGSTASKNQLLTNKSTTYSNTISFDNENNVVIKGTSTTLRFNSSAGSTNYRFRYYKSGQQAIQLYKWVEEAACAHAETKTEVINATTHKVVCADCGEVITASVTCTATSWTEWTPNLNDELKPNGTHTCKGKCECGNEVTKPEDCDIQSDSISNDDGTHSNKGTCTKCKAETTAVIDCTPNGTVVDYVDNGNGTHNEITNCTECNGEVVIEKGCSYTEDDNGTSVTYTCKYCDYSYTINKYTVEFSVPDSVECETAVAYVLPGATVELPTTTAPEGYTFVGWTTEKTVSKKQPDLFTADKTVNGNMKLYALYKFVEGGNTQIERADQLQIGMTVAIVANDGATAMSTNQKSNNRGATAFKDENGNINIGEDIQLLTLMEGTTAGTYALYTGAGYLYAAGSGSGKNYLRTQATNNVDGNWTITFDDNKVASIVAAGSSNTNNIMQCNPNNGNPLFSCYGEAKYTALTLWAIGAEVTYTSYVTPTIAAANLTIGETLTMNYKVAMNDSFKDAVMEFTFLGNTIEVAGEKNEDGLYVYSLQIAPQHMGEEIKAELKLDGTVLASKESYSVKAYAEYQLANSNNETLKQLVADMLLYGAAAQVYTNYDVENLVADLDNLGAAPETNNDFSLARNEEINTYPAYFVGAGVRFGADNKIFVELSTVENVTLEVNGEEVELNGTTYYTEGLKATQFGDTFTFELYCDGVLMQTLTYSVNAYAYQFAGGDDAMANLAIALYNYGMSAENYVA